MLGELAQRYPRGGLVISTGAYHGSAASDAQVPQPVDRVRIRATRLRTVHGLVWWTARAGALARRLRPGFIWCGELKPAGYAARWLHARYRIPYDIIVYGTELLLLDAKNRRSGFKRRTAASLLGNAAAIVAISRWTADLARDVLRSLGGRSVELAERVETVPLGTTPSRFRPEVDPAPAIARYGLEAPGPLLLTVARLEWHKGIDTVLQALPQIRAAHPGTRYLVAGVGDRLPHFQRIAAELELGDAVRFLGLVPDADLPALYRAADLYVGVSRRHALLAEGFGISLVEASASGLAVVGGRSGGVADAVREGETGILVDPDDPAAVAAGVSELLADPERRRRMGEAGRRLVETYYNWDRVARELIEIDRRFRVTG